LATCKCGFVGDPEEMKRVTWAICGGCADDGRCREVTHEDFVMIAFFKGQETGRSVVSLEDALGPDRAGSVDLGNHGAGGESCAGATICLDLRILFIDWENAGAEGARGSFGGVLFL